MVRASSRLSSRSIRSILAFCSAAAFTPLSIFDGAQPMVTSLADCKFLGSGSNTTRSDAGWVEWLRRDDSSWVVRGFWSESEVPRDGAFVNFHADNVCVWQATGFEW